MKWIYATCLLVACSSTEDEPKGELMLAITSDLVADKDIDRLTVEVKRPEGAILRREVFDLGRPTGSPLPATLAMTAATDPGSAFVIRIHAYSNNFETYVLREVVTSIPRDRIALVRVPLEWLCFGSGYYVEEQAYVESSCEHETTCKGGVCEKPEVDEAVLPTYEDGLVFGGGGPDGGGTCFDTFQCFSDTEGAVLVAAPDGAPVGDGGGGGAGGDGGAGGGSAGPCTIPIPPGMTVANVALVTDGRHGHCYDGGPCLIPLDRGGASGWSVDGDTLLLPPGTCDAPSWFLGAFASTPQIALTPACNAKAPEVPLCGEHSAVGPGSSPTLSPPLASQ